METLNGRGEADGGFTLIEVLVSFAILVAAIAVLQTGFGGGWRSVRAANMESEALEIARAKLAAAGIETPLVPGATEGDAGGGYSWRVVIEPHGVPGEAANETSLGGYWTTVQVMWNDRRARDGRQISLTTLKVKRPPEAQP